MAQLQGCFGIISTRYAVLQVQTLVDNSSNQFRGGLKSSDSIINNLVMFTISTGAITFSASAGHLILFLASPNTGVHLAFHFVVPKLFTNSLYASLNIRAAFQGKGENNRTGHVKSRGQPMFAGLPMVDSSGVPDYVTVVSHLLLSMQCLPVYDSVVRCIGSSIIYAAPSRDHVHHRNPEFSQPAACCSTFGKAGITDKLWVCLLKKAHLPA
jgi:hypothetical protein